MDPPRSYSDLSRAEKWMYYGVPSSKEHRRAIRAQRDSYFASRLGPENAGLHERVPGLIGPEVDRIESHRGRSQWRAAVHASERQERSRSRSDSLSRSRSRGAGEAGSAAVIASRLLGEQTRSRSRSQSRFQGTMGNLPQQPIRSSSRSNMRSSTQTMRPFSNDPHTSASRSSSRTASRSNMRPLDPDMHLFYPDRAALSPGPPSSLSSRTTSRTSMRTRTPDMQLFHNDMSRPSTFSSQPHSYGTCHAPTPFDNRVLQDMLDTYDNTMTLLQPNRDFDTSRLTPLGIPPRHSPLPQELLRAQRPPSRGVSPLMLPESRFASEGLGRAGADWSSGQGRSPQGHGGW